MSGDELSVGDVLFQPKQEIFNVIIEEEDDSFYLAIHGWREVDKERLEKYMNEIEGDKMFFTREEMREMSDDEVDEFLDQLEELIFDVYDET